jgi:hypothetical protein
MKMNFKLTVGVVLFFILNTFLFGQSVLSEWKNPQVFGINKLPPRAHFFPYWAAAWPHSERREQLGLRT